MSESETGFCFLYSCPHHGHNSPLPNRLPRSQFLSDLDLVSCKIYLAPLTNALGTCGLPSLRRLSLKIDCTTNNTLIPPFLPPPDQIPPPPKSILVCFGLGKLQNISTAPDERAGHLRISPASRRRAAQSGPGRRRCLRTARRRCLCRRCPQSSAPSVARPRSRCRPPGGPTTTSSIARSSPRVGRLPRRPSSPRPAVTVDATIVIARREGRNRRAWLSTRRHCRAARATNRPAATRIARPISIPCGTWTPRTPPPPHHRRSPSDPPPIAAATTATAQELGVRAEGGIFILFFLFAWREASGYWQVTPHQLSLHYCHDCSCTEFLRELGRGKR